MPTRFCFGTLTLSKNVWQNGDEPLINVIGDVLTPGDSMSQIWPLFLKKAGLKESEMRIVSGDAQTKLNAVINGQADLLLGYVPADFFLGGEIPLDVAAAEAAIATIAEPLGLTLTEAAAAIFVTANSYMADQITEVATRRGHDVRDLTMVAGGGAGPVHAASIADALHIPTVVIPPVAATYSAFGMFAMDVGRNYARSYISRASQIDTDRVDRLYEEMEQEARDGFSALDVAPTDIAFARTADLRYIGQFHEVEVEVPAGELGPDVIATAMSWRPSELKSPIATDSPPTPSSPPHCRAWPVSATAERSPQTYARATAQASSPPSRPASSAPTAGLPSRSPPIHVPNEKGGGAPGKRRL